MSVSQYGKLERGRDYIFADIAVSRFPWIREWKFFYQVDIHFVLFFSDLKEAIRHLTLLIYVHLMTITIVLSLIVITLMVWKLIYYKRRKEMTRNLRHLPQVVCDRGLSVQFLLFFFMRVRRSLSLAEASKKRQDDNTLEM